MAASDVATVWCVAFCCSLLCTILTFSLLHVLYCHPLLLLPSLVTPYVSFCHTPAPLFISRSLSHTPRIPTPGPSSPPRPLSPHIAYVVYHRITAPRTSFSARHYSASSPRRSMSFLVPVYALRLAVYHLFFIGVELGVVWTTCIDGVAYSLIVDVAGLLVVCSRSIIVMCTQ